MKFTVGDFITPKKSFVKLEGCGIYVVIRVNKHSYRVRAVTKQQCRPKEFRLPILHVDTCYKKVPKIKALLAL